MATSSEEGINRIGTFVASHLESCCGKDGSSRLTRRIEHFDAFGEITVSCTVCGVSETAAVNYETAEFAKREVDAAVTEEQIDALFNRARFPDDDSDDSA